MYLSKIEKCISWNCQMDFSSEQDWYLGAHITWWPFQMLWYDHQLPHSQSLPISDSLKVQKTEWPEGKIKKVYKPCWRKFFYSTSNPACYPSPLPMGRKTTLEWITISPLPPSPPPLVLCVNTLCASQQQLWNVFSK